MSVIVLKKASVRVEEFPWGRLEWHASGALQNSGALTLGRCILKPGCGNTPHIHPNCCEILRVESGRIAHRYGGRSVDMEPGDTITVPAGVYHGAVNLGEEEAVMTIVFDTPDRQTDFSVLEPDKERDHG